ncbi:hypothetical protein WI80_33420 [Burkholderia ubonensis]|uniref:hypothetical protein n=1 Tax=Burkholderia ubonensis TaxID=101571 RepID=UPI0007593CFC|nr:hypothetical protein [Burkholderia ubonensis]KVD19196.1 hypothetical protein WI80_33420 [Burkholderia ubonensis]KVU12675.1 hypothetical protein WK63_19450 [Burkholderia ubonensis]
MLPALVLAFNFVMQHPQVANDAVARIEAPGNFDQRELQGAVADVAHAVLTCYHKTARIQGIRDTRLSLRDASNLYGADQSKILVIRYSGITGATYAMAVALMGRGDGDSAQLRAVVLRDTAIIPYARSCPLQDWTSVS